MDYLSPQALAYWIIGDGQYVKRGGITLCTDNFTLTEVLILKNALESKFGLLCTLHKKNKYHRIYISKRSFDKLVFIVKPYMHPLFIYKLDN